MLAARACALAPFGACLLVAGCRAPRGGLEATPPVARGTIVDTLPTLPPSVVEAPIAYDLDDARAALEQVVPATFGDIGTRLEIPSNRRMHVAFAARRSPFHVRVAGDSIELTTLVRYEGRGWYKPPLAPEIGASCGTGDDAPRVRARLVSTVKLTGAWKLDVRTRLRDLAPASDSARDMCRVTLFKIDVTDRVLGAVRVPLERKLTQVDARMDAIDVRSRLERVWSILQRPIRVGDSLWFRIDPERVRLGALSGDGANLIARVGLTATPRIVSGPRPADGTRPLPPLERSRTLGRRAHLLLEARLDYALASAMLDRALDGRRFTQASKTFEIAGVNVYPVGDGRIALRVRFRGDASGTAYLVGTPVHSVLRNELEVPDLDFDVATEDLLVRSAAWVARDQVRDYLRERAHWPVGEMIERVRERTQRALNRELTRGVRLAATVDSGEVLAVRAMPDAFVVRAHADGDLRLDIDREIPVARR